MPTPSYSEGVGHYRGDNDTVIKSWNEALVHSTPSRYMSKLGYGGLLRLAFGNASQRITASWVKAHTDISSFEKLSPEWLDSLGNSYADEWAAKGRLRHPVPTPGENKEWHDLSQSYSRAMQSIARALAVWAEHDTKKIDWQDHPKNPTKLDLRPGQGLRLQHRFRHHKGQGERDRTNPPRCTQCLAKVQGKGECKPQRHWANGHQWGNHKVQAYVTQSGFHLWACSKCHGWAELLPRSLAGLCLSHPTEGKTREYDLIARVGHHPHFQSDLVQPVSSEAIMHYRLAHATMVEAKPPQIPIPKPVVDSTGSHPGKSSAGPSIAPLSGEGPHNLQDSSHQEVPTCRGHPGG